MANRERITIFTAPGRYDNSLSVPTYRKIVGIERNGHLHVEPNTSIHTPTTERYDIPKDLAANITQYFAEHYLNDPEAIRNCHIGAAAMTNAGIKLTLHESLKAAEDIVSSGRLTEMIEVGEWGVIGEVITKYTPQCMREEYDENDEFDEFDEFDTVNDLVFGFGPTAHHNVVGLTPDECIQTDSMQGPLSIASIEETLRLYQEQIERVNARFYSK